MNFILPKILLTATICASAISASAVKAKPGVVTYTQPDGSLVEIMLHGDEHSHFATSLSGELLLTNPEGFYEYAVKDSQGLIKTSGIKAGHSPLSIKERLVSGDDCFHYARTAKPRKSSRVLEYTRSSAGGWEPRYRYTASAFPTKGEPHSLVVLVEYQNVKFNLPDPQKYFDDFLNGENFTGNGATGSCRQYYIDNSNGLFKPTFDVYGPILLANNRVYYGGGRNEDRAHEMVIEAVKALDPDVDFSQYDHNNDGYVDSIYIIYADKGEADGGPAESVWPHSWELSEIGVTLEADGVKFDTYGCSNETQGDGKPTGIGTFTHEFGHVMGMPDLYNTENDYDYTTPCYWSLMDCGSYNNDGRTPPNLSSFERYCMGWLMPEEIYSSGEYALENLSLSNKAYIMTTEERKDEFFIMDYRLQENWDAFLPAQGLLIWQIDFDQKAWDDNTVNNQMYRQKVRLIRADGIATVSTDKGDPFPGYYGITKFDASSPMPLMSWQKNPLNVTSLTEIREEEGKAIFYATVTEDRSEEAGVQGVESIGSTITVNGNILYTNSGEIAVYDLAGRFAGIATPDSPLRLDKGIYIAGRQKFIIK